MICASHKSRLGAFWAIGVALPLCGCGSSLIILEIDASRSVPDEVDSLYITTLDSADPTGGALADIDLPLEEGDDFPIEVLLEPSDSTPAEIQHRVIARLGGVQVLEKLVQHKWKEGLTNRAKFTLDDEAQ
ncbi:MAG: hypothetical protein A2289_06400 [Deltaproteobacteria bacterium RIFOXYA12_FULL_58_15]|nr:MAG: hypothetical protein A2289_06400 [Deltaproteobacteria bacterium RIFOXYA12_FULL_58_15]OGR10205.1 MAG: hypothetical protein A2341_06295 [Deltaproteobacteria bacterium RIFOXYB12_FULL_58_9]